MNITALLEFESLVYPGLQNSTIRTLVAQSLRSVLQQAIIDVTTAIMVMVSCRYEGVLDFMSHIMFELRNVTANGTLQLMEQNHRRLLRVNGRRLFNLVLVDSLEGFLDLELASYVKNYETNEHTYIFLQQRDHLVEEEMQAVFEYCWRHHMINCNIQTQSANAEIRMYTYYPYTRHNCGRVIRRQINNFVPGLGWKQGRPIFPHKLTNLYGCPLTVAVRDIPPFIKVYNTSGKMGNLGNTCNHKSIGPRLGGFEGCLIVELAKHMNFTVNATLLEVDDRTGEYCCGIMAWLQEKKIDLGIGYFRKRTYMVPFSTNVFPHYQNDLVAAVNVNAHNLTAYEILLYPFDGYTWLSTLIALLLAFVCAEVMYWFDQHHERPPRFLTFCALLATSLGLPVTREPRTLHNRLVFSGTMWTTFLLRGIYSAILYSIFRDSIHRRLPRYGPDLIRHNYMTVMNSYTLVDIKERPDLSDYKNLRSMIIKDPNELVAFPILQAEENDLLFSVSAREFLVYYSIKNQQPGKFHLLHRNIMTQQLCIYLVKHSFLVDQLDLTIMRFHAAGVMQFLQKRTLDDTYFKSRHLYGQKFINQQDLIAIYMLVGVVQFIAFILFLLELAAGRSARLRALFERRS